jgi:succinate dehydrogenase / fumarate reductase, cytochrome b subunit
MSARTGVFSSSVGTKILIGLTGLALFAYLILHIAGNVLVFFGPSVFNQYSHALLSNPLIPVIEIGLVIIFVIHIYKAVRMYLANQQARPVRYVRRRSAGAPSRKSPASSTMIVSGLWLLLFVMVHVRQFKYGTEYQTGGMRDLYRLEMENFANPLLVAFYVISMAIVGSHLWHGIASAFQSLGADHPRWTPRLLSASKVLAVAIAGGFVMIAVWAYLHQIGHPQP